MHIRYIRYVHATRGSSYILHAHPLHPLRARHSRLILHPTCTSVTSVTCTPLAAHPTSYMHIRYIRYVHATRGCSCILHAHPLHPLRARHSRLLLHPPCTSVTSVTCTPLAAAPASSMHIRYIRYVHAT